MLYLSFTQAFCLFGAGVGVGIIGTCIIAFKFGSKKKKENPTS